MFEIDQMAYASPLNKLPPLGKLLLALALLLASLLSTSPLVPLLVFAIGMCLLYWSTKLVLPDIVSLACVNTFAMLAISVFIIALIAPGAPWFSANLFGFELKLSHGGANLAIILFIRALAGFSVLLFFASSTPIPHLFYALRQVGLPKHIAELTILIYRYSFMLFEQMGQMYVAADCRMGFGGILKSLSTTARIMAGLFSRSMDFAQRAENALLCRNFQGEFLPFREPAKLNFAWAAGSVLLFAALYALAIASRNMFIL